MPETQNYQRPPFAIALEEWRKALVAGGQSADCEWILDENLVFEKDAQAPTGLRLSFQTQFTARPADLASVTYDFFTDYEARLVFYRLGTCRGKSICLLLCDPVFETRTEQDGFQRRDDWLISFYVGGGENLEEITDVQRWKNRLVSGRPLSDVDFCMPLAILREIEVHGRALSPNERFGVRMVDAWQRWRRSDGE